jgi:hypothetical protein
MFVRDHLFSQGEAVDRGHILSDALILGVDYSLTDRLAARVELPYIVSKYNGPYPHDPRIDNGTYHSTFQDFTIDLRYHLINRPVILVPFFTMVVPSHSYTYFAHSAVGRDQREYHVGMNFGRRLDPILPKAFLQARYGYAFVERVLGISPNRSDVEATLGYFLTPHFSLSGTSQWVHTYSGVSFPFGVFHAGLSDEQWLHHDQIGKVSLLDLGGGASYAVKPSWVIFASVARSLEGRNGHFHAAVITVGLSKSFGTRFAAEKASLGPPGESVPPPTKTLVCTCARSK